MQHRLIRNAHEITSSTGAGFLFVFKAYQKAHSKLRNCWHNAEDGQKDKRVVEVIPCTFLSRWIAVVLATVIISACVSNKKPHEPLSKKKEADLYLQMAVRYLEMNMLSEAKGKLEAAVETDSNNEKVYNVLGVLHERLMQYDKAGDAYQTAVKINSDNASIKNNYGRFLCERGDYPAGIKLLKQAVQMPLNNKKWFAYTNIGRCELLHGQQSLAESYFRQALLVNKNYAPALLEMQKASYLDGKYLSARAFLQRFLALASHTSSTLWYGVQTEYALGNSGQAEKYKEQLFSQFPVSKETQQLKKQ